MLQKFNFILKKILHQTSTSPLFLLVAVAIGMFNNETAGLVIACAHCLGNLTLGLGLRFYGGKYNRSALSGGPSLRETPARAFREMINILEKEQRPFGKIMGDAVRNSVTNLLNIGGFIIIFAVLIKLLAELGFISVPANLMGGLLVPLGISPAVLEAVASGFFEMTIGTKMASYANADILQQLIAVGIILAWSGLSIHAQVASMVAHTDIRLGPFIIARVIHTALAAVYTVLLNQIFEPRLNTVSVFHGSLADCTILPFIKVNLLAFFAVLFLLLATGLILYFLRSIFHLCKRL